MSSLKDSYSYESYSLENYEVSHGPPLKTSRLIAAVVQNRVDILRNLLDSPKWYNVTDKWDFTLLQIAVNLNNEEVFDYMMSLPDFPFDFVDRCGETALSVSLMGISFNTKEHFPCELLKKGACIYNVCCDTYPPLHCALEMSRIRLAKLLMEAGLDVNIPDDCGKTPLDLALQCNYMSEAVTALLIYGAEPSFKHFSTSVIIDAPLVIQENILLYLYDKYSKVEIGLDVLLKLAETSSPLFHEIIKFPIEFNVSDQWGYSYFRVLCSIAVDYLKIIIQKFGSCVSEALGKDISCLSFYRHDFNRAIPIENLNVMLESNVRSDVIAIINRLNSSEIFEGLIDREGDESTIKELYCFLLSYGLNIDEMDLQLVYKKFGYCDLFKILLNMDIKMITRMLYRRDAMPIFIYDVSLNLEKFLTTSSRYANVKSINELSSYFAYPQWRKMHSRRSDRVRKKVQQVPLLVELSRNAFRNFFIENFQITTSRKFLTLLNCLPISPVYKKIITYETKLY